MAHRNSWITELQDGDFPVRYVSLPEAISLWNLRVWLANTPYMAGQAIACRLDSGLGQGLVVIPMTKCSATLRYDQADIASSHTLR